MGSFSSKLGKKKAIAAAVAAPTVAAPVLPVAEVAPASAAAPAAPVDGAPPWAWSECLACKGVGFASTGTQCRICLHKTKFTGTVSFEVLDDGAIAWAVDDAAGVFMPPGQEAQVVVTEAKAVVRPPKEQKIVAEPEVVPVNVSEVTPKPVEGKGKGGRPRKGFILLINCGPLKAPSARQNSGRHVYYLSELLPELGEEMAVGRGVDSYYEIDFFARRDLFAQAGEEIASRFGTDVVVAEGVSTAPSDMKFLVDAIRPFAGMVIFPQN
jgi:hypothetical protein